MKKFVALRKMVHIIMAVLTFFLIKEIYVHPVLEASLFMAWGTYWVIDLSKVLFNDTDYEMLGGFLTFWLGSILLILFSVWLGNIVLKIFNLGFYALGLDFSIGNLYKGIFQYVFSFPSLICGAILLYFGFSWDKYMRYRILRFVFTQAIILNAKE